MRPKSGIFVLTDSAIPDGAVAISSLCTLFCFRCHPGGESSCLHSLINTVLHPRVRYATDLFVQMSKPTRELQNQNVRVGAIASLASLHPEPSPNPHWCAEHGSLCSSACLPPSSWFG